MSVWSIWRFTYVYLPKQNFSISIRMHKFTTTNSRFQWAIVLNIHSKLNYSKLEVCSIQAATYALNIIRNKYKFKSNSEWKSYSMFFSIRLPASDSSVSSTFNHQTVTACDCNILFNGKFIHLSGKRQASAEWIWWIRWVYSTICVVIRIERWLKAECEWSIAGETERKTKNDNV